MFPTSLRRNLFLWSVTVGLLSVSVIGAVVTLTLVRVFKQDMAAQQLGQARVQAIQIRNTMNEVADDLRVLGGQCLAKEQRCSDFLQHLLVGGSGYQVIEVAGPDGFLTRRSRRNDGGVTAAEAALLGTADRWAGNYRVGRHEKVEGWNYLPIAVPLPGGEVRALLHVPKLHLSREILAASGQADAAYVLDRDGRVVAHSDWALIEQVGLSVDFPVSLDSGEETNLQGLPALATEVTGSYYFLGKYWRFAAAPVPGMPWMAFTRVNAQALPDRLMPMVGPVLASLVGLTLFTLAGWAVQMRGVMRQFGLLSSAARHLAGGRLATRVPVARVQEFRMLSDALEEMRQKLLSHRLETLRAIMGALEARDDYTRGHSERVMQYAVAIGRAMGMEPEELEELRVGAILHDVGKIALDRSILNKPGPLNAQEWEAVRQHPVVGAGILGSVSALDRALPMVRWHHERLDGSGYPDGLRGDEIPLPVRILAVADAFDAMTSNRPYRGPMPVTQALAQLRARTPQEYDPRVVECLEGLAHAHPEWFPLPPAEVAG